MLQLEQLEKGVMVKGIEADGSVTVVSADWLDEGALEVVYRDGSGGIGNVVLYRSHEPVLGLAEAGGWEFTADGALFRLAVEAHRLRMAYLSDPRLAVHTSLIEPLPHQISAVYEHMLPLQPMRFLLADDPGAGKTIMAGLLMKELVARGVLERCLVVCPGGLVEQWQDELWQKFGLRFEIMSREKVETSPTGNPFAEHDFAIGRLDHVSRNEEVKEGLGGTEWDLIVVDEAHKMSATFSGGEIDRTRRYRLGELLSGLTRHLLFLTATPHSGKEEDFQLFLKLLDTDRFEGRFRDGVHRADTSDVMRRTVKEDLRRFDGTFLFPDRVAHTVGYDLSPSEAELYEAVTAYVRDEFNRAEALKGRVRTVGFALTSLQRRLASSPEAIYRSLVRRRERLEGRLKEVQKNASGLDEGRLQRPAGMLEDYEEAPVEELEESEEEYEEAEEEVMDLATAASNARELQAEISTLVRLEGMAAGVRGSGTDRKWEKLSELLQDEELLRDGEGNRRKLIVFTEHRDTLGYLAGRLRGLLGRGEEVIEIHGGMNRHSRQEAQERFLNNPEVSVLVATDAAGEGVNLQRANLMVNYDLPWNPNRLEQRFGRIHRIGQTEVCHLWNLVAGDTREGAVYSRLLEKLEAEREALGGRVFDVVGKLFRETPLRELLIQAIRDEGSGGMNRDVEGTLDSAVDHERLRALVEDRALTPEAMDPALLGRIREDMERAEARRLQPHFVESFFLEAFRRLGGRPREREPGRHELGRLPPIVYNRARTLPGSNRISDAYQRVAFDKELVRVGGSVPATFLHPGHPVFDAVVNLTLERNGDTLSEGAVLVDGADPGVEPRALVMLEHTVHDGSDSVASRRMQFVELLQDGGLRGAGSAPHLDYRPLREQEREPAEAARRSFGMDVDQRARSYAASRLAPEHLEEVRRLRDEQSTRAERAVWERLTREISYQDRRSAEFRERARGPEDRLNADNAARERDALIERRNRRMEELKRERHLNALPPRVLGAALVLPAGTLEADDSPDFPHDEEAARRVEELAMRAVMEAEQSLGHSPRDVSAENRGYDIESKGASNGRLRMIEVKGRTTGAATVTVTKNEILTALNRPEDYILAIVEVEDGSAGEPHYIRRPFENQPDFHLASGNFDLGKLLENSVPPG